MNGISLIIITHNRKLDLKRTLEKLDLLNKPKNFEIIVIDQNSTDGTEELFDSYFSNVRYEKLNVNLGVAGGRNKGVELANYEYMVFLDDDAEFLSPNALTQIEKKFEINKGINILAFKIYNNNFDLYNWAYPKRLLKLQDKDFYTNMYIGCGHAIRKSFFLSVNGYSNNLFFWGEEIELSLKSFAYNNSPVLYTGDIQVLHRVTPKGRISEKNGRYYYKVRNRLAIINNIYPTPFRQLYNLFYLCAYGVKSLLIKTTKQYLSGLKDYKSVKMDVNRRINLRSLIKYIFIHYI
ncbi:glycosyltransferase [Caldifermentibacillus hisashii]|uniref:glycosyltransferase family 2 protein n=1 Tax=Caldifermentibacillus hisashii TaxID=996558 RepID=UPI0030D6854D